MSKRLRHSVLLLVYRALKPVLQLRSASIVHADSHLMTRLNAVLRQVSLAQATGIDTSPQQLGSHIRIRRLEKGWTQSDLAARAGLTLSQISRIEHGRVMVRRSTLKRIDQALRAPMA